MRRGQNDSQSRRGLEHTPNQPSSKEKQSRLQRNSATAFEEATDLLSSSPAMVEAVVISGVWFTARLVCQVSYRAIKSYRSKRAKIDDDDECAGDGEGGAYSGSQNRWSEGKSLSAASGSGSPQQQSSSKELSHVDDEGVNRHAAPPPWVMSRETARRDLSRDPGRRNTAEDVSPAVWAEEDRKWLEGIMAANVEQQDRDNKRLLQEIRRVGDKIDEQGVKRQLSYIKKALGLFREYQADPSCSDGSAILDHAAEAATNAYYDDQSPMSTMDALRIRVAIKYLRSLKDAKPEEGKRRCIIYVRDALKTHFLDVSQTFLRAVDAIGFSEEPSRAKRDDSFEDATAMLNIILEIMSSVSILEPYSDVGDVVSQMDVPRVLMLALHDFCEMGFGDSALYVDMAAYIHSQNSMPDKQESAALRALYNSTNGPDWLCREGWETLLISGAGSCFGVTIEDGRVTKLSLGCNNLDGQLPDDICNLRCLRELALPGNKLRGAIPAGVWDLPNLKVVALQGNEYKDTPPSKRMEPCARTQRRGSLGLGGLSLDGALGPRKSKPREDRCCQVLVEACHPNHLQLNPHEWFACSWKVTNIGTIPFPSNVKLMKIEVQSPCMGGADTVRVNPLEPGEEQQVYVMQQAPSHGWAHEQWRLVGPSSLDFPDDDSFTQSPTLAVRSPSMQNDRRLSQGASMKNWSTEHPTMHNTVYRVAR